MRKVLIRWKSFKADNMTPYDNISKNLDFVQTFQENELDWVEHCAMVPDEIMYFDVQETT